MPIVIAVPGLCMTIVQSCAADLRPPVRPLNLVRPVRPVPLLAGQAGWTVPVPQVQFAIKGPVVAKENNEVKCIGATLLWLVT